MPLALPISAAARHVLGAQGTRTVSDLFGRFPPWQYPVGAWKMAGIAIGIVLQVILMHGFRLPEGPNRLDLSHGLAWPQARRVDVRDCILGNPFLPIIDIVD